MTELYGRSDYHASWLAGGDRTAEGGELAYFASLRQRWAQRLRELAGSGARTLEIACGTGRFLLHCRERGLRPLGVELSLYAAVECRRLDVEVAVADFSSGAVRSGGFDAVVMHQFLEHVTQPVEVLRQAYALLRPGGVLLATTPNLGGISTRLVGARNYALDPATGHCTIFTRGSFAAAVGAAGFEVVDAWSDQVFFGNLFDLLPRRLRGRRRFPAAPGFQSVRQLVQGRRWALPLLRLSDAILRFLRLGDQLTIYAVKPLR